MTRKEESTYLALQATGLGDIFSIGEGGAPTQLDLVRGSRRGRLESVRVVVVMGARVLCGNGRVVEGISRRRRNRYMRLRSACAGVVEHLDIAAGRAVIGSVIGVVALQILEK